MTNLMPWKKKKDGKEEEFFHPMVSLQKEMNQLFEDFSKGFEDFFPTRTGERGDFLPRVDVAETEKEITVTAELPGASEKDIEVSLDRDVLTIKGEKQQEREDKQKHYHYVERKYGSFYRRIPIPVEVDQTKIEAAFKNGVLHVALPKKEVTASQAKKIEIKAS